MSDPSEAIRRVNVAGLRITALTTHELIERVVGKAAASSEKSSDSPPLFLSYANAWSVCLARDHADYARILNDVADLVYADGQSVVWASRWLGAPLPERVNAGDCLIGLLTRLSERGATVGLIGGAKGLAERAAERLRARVPGLRVSGVWPGYVNANEEEALAASIREHAPSVLLVGMSAPRQERWAAEWKGRLGSRVVWCVGALFEYYAGGRSRAPRWMRQCGLEWAYRLCLEPGRLWRRYLIGNCRFIWLVLRRNAGRQ